MTQCLSPCIDADMSKLLRSEEMNLVQIFLSQEASYNCIRELGELVSIQFGFMPTKVSVIKMKNSRSENREIIW